MLGLVFVLVVPASHQCVGISAVAGQLGGRVCAWSTPLTGSAPASIALVAAFVVVGLAVQLVSTDPRFLIVVGALTTIFWVTSIFVLLPAYQVGFWLSSHGVETLSNELETELLLMLPSGLLPLAAGIRRRGHAERAK